MTDEPNRIRSFVEVWVRRTLTISWLVTRWVLFFPFCFSCEVFGILASFVIWLASGVWLGTSRTRFLNWNFALQRWWANALCRGAQ